MYNQKCNGHLLDPIVQYVASSIEYITVNNNMSVRIVGKLGQIIVNEILISSTAEQYWVTFWLLVDGT